MEGPLSQSACFDWNSNDTIHYYAIWTRGQGPLVSGVRLGRGKVRFHPICSVGYPVGFNDDAEEGAIQGRMFTMLLDVKINRFFL